MGKGTLHKKDHKPTTLQVVVDLKRLYCHSAKIMPNEKVFNPKNDFHNSTLIRINETLLDMFSKAFTANTINVEKEPRLAGERLALQCFAIEDARQLLAVFDLAKSQFHLPERKFWNWMEMLVEAKNKLVAWHKSDFERYGANIDLSNQGGIGLNTRRQLSSAVC